LTGPFANATIAVSLILAMVCAVFILLNKVPPTAVLIGAAVLELMLIAFFVGGIVQMLGSNLTFQRWEFIAYLLSLVIIPPLGVGWAWSEKNRSGTIVLLVVFLLIPVLIVRVQQVWSSV